MREEIARVIDPDAWAYFDTDAGQHNGVDLLRFAAWKQSSLRKADQCLALLHSTPVAGGEGSDVAVANTTPVASPTPPITAADVHHHPDNNQDSPAVKVIVAAAVEMANSGELFRRQPTAIDAAIGPPREGLQELRALSEAAHVGEWDVSEDAPGTLDILTDHTEDHSGIVAEYLSPPTARFIVAACNYVRALLSGASYAQEKSVATTPSLHQDLPQPGIDAGFKSPPREGWVTVPIKPTDAMRGAMYLAAKEAFAAADQPGPVAAWFNAKAIYRAMIAAAPSGGSYSQDALDRDELKEASSDVAEDRSTPAQESAPERAP